jgi:hypothetical protein
MAQELKKANGMGCLIATGVIILFIFIGICTSNGSSDSNDCAGAYYEAKDAVKAQLKSPSSADFTGEYNCSQSGSTYYITSEVDAENSFGAKLRRSWSASVTYANGSWTVNSVYVAE